MQFKIDYDLQLDKALRIFKLTALVACWVLLTVSLILNQESTDTILHTAVDGGEIKGMWYLVPDPLSRRKIENIITKQI